MWKRLFGRNEPVPPPVTPSPAPTPRWATPRHALLPRFALHVRLLPLEELAQAVRERYLLHRPSTAEAALLVPQGEWVSVFFPRETVQGVGFNRQASQIAAERGVWVVGYRGFGEEGLDAHIFHGGEHVAQLAHAGREVEWDLDDPTLFTSLAALDDLLPHPATQHPQETLFSVLERFGIAEPALSWEEARARYAAGGWLEARMLRGSAE